MEELEGEVLSSDAEAGARARRLAREGRDSEGVVPPRRIDACSSGALHAASGRKWPNVVHEYVTILRARFNST